MDNNFVFITGMICKEPELKYANSGSPILNLDVVNNHTYVKSEKKSESSFFKVVVFGSYAEKLAESLQNKNKVAVTGKIVIKPYDTGTKKGVNVVIYASEIRKLEHNDKGTKRNRQAEKEMKDKDYEENFDDEFEDDDSFQF